MSKLRGIGWSKVLVVMSLGCGDPDSPAPPAGTGAAAGMSGSGAQAGGGGTAGSSGGSGGGTAGSTGGSGGGAGAMTGGSGGASGGSSGTGGSSGGAAGSGAAGSGGSSGGAGTGGTEGSPMGYIQFGTLFNFPSLGQTYSFANARFDRGDTQSTSVCTTQTFGPCTIYTCEEDTDPPDPMPVTFPTAGVITIESDMGEFSATLEPNSSGAYTGLPVMGALQGEETVTVTAVGDEVPAFTHTVSFPLVLLLTSPVLATGESTITASRTEDLVLTWDRGIDGLSFAVQSTGGTSFFCSVASTDGTMTIPAAALAALPANTGLLPIGSGVDHVMAGDYDVSVTHANGVMTPDRMQRVQVMVP